MAFHVIDAPQRSPEWFASRAGRLTGSVASKMLSLPKKGSAETETVGRRDLRLKLALERICGRSLESEYTNKAMQAGIEKEPYARAAYELATGNIVFEAGFLAHDELMAGASIDGYLGGFDTLVSIKCREWAAHLEFLRNGTIPKNAMDQMRHELWIAEATTHTYVSWNPDFPPELQLKFTVLRAESMELPAYALAARLFLSEVEAEVESINALRLKDAPMLSAKAL